MIKLSKLTDYAVVVLAEMARSPGALLPAGRLAERTGVPEPTVAKLLKLLARDGLVVSERGVAGGYRLDRAAGDVPVTDIITAVEGPIALTACVEGSHSSCALESSCAMKGRWTPVNTALKNALAHVSLADMVG